MARKKNQEDQHFSGLGDCRIHTSRSHTTCSVASKEKDGSCDHQANCSDKPTPTWKPDNAAWVWGDEWESHHILCIGTVNRYRGLKAFTSDERARIDAVYRATEWCINQKPNLIGLPMRKVYQEYEGARSLNLPCHDWDHNIAGGYADEVAQELYTKVWQKLKAASSKTVCKLAKSVAQEQLEALSTLMRRRLKSRGRRKVGNDRGTLAAWGEGAGGRSPRAKQWWFPFSMAEDSVAAARDPGKFGKPKWASAKARQEFRDALRASREKR